MEKSIWSNVLKTAEIILIHQKTLQAFSKQLKADIINFKYC